MKRFLIILLVAALCAAVLIWVIWARQPGVSDADAEPTAAEKPRVLARPSYPKLAPFPDSSKFIDRNTGAFDTHAYEKAYREWQESRFSVRSEKAAAQTEDSFLETVSPALLDTGKSNPVYSPANLNLALSMLTELTGGETRQQLMTLLGAADMETVRSRAAELWSANYQDDGAVTCRMANSLWMQEGFPVTPTLPQTLAERYFASSYQGQLGTPEANALLQSWLRDETGGLLREQADNMSLEPDTVLALVSALYYKAAWETRFHADATAEDVFYSPEGERTCLYLNGVQHGQLYAADQFTAAEIGFQYAGSMLLILPKEDTSPQALLYAPELYTFIQNRQSCPGQSCSIALSLPKFDVSSDADLIDALKTLGVSDVFDPNCADFSPAADVPGLAVSQIRHAARIRLDEEGCEAAAFTVISDPEAAAMPEEPIPFRLDRPFLFCITRNGSLPLFFGILYTP